MGLACRIPRPPTESIATASHPGGYDKAIAAAYGSPPGIRVAPAVGGPSERGGTLTIAIASGQVDADTAVVPPKRSRRRMVKRILLIVGTGLFALVATIATIAGISLWRIDHNVHHVGVPAALLAKGKNDLLAIVRVRTTARRPTSFTRRPRPTKVLTIPSAPAPCPWPRGRPPR